MDKISAAVLAGGMSRRFGTDKTQALLENKPLIQWVTEGVKRECDEVLVIAKDLSKYEFLDGVRLIQDNNDQQCPLVGLLTAFENAAHSNVFLISADMPLFPYEAIPAMCDLLDCADAVLPEIGGKLYPCGAMYRKSTQAQFTKLFEEGNFRMTDILEQIDSIRADEDFFVPYGMNYASFININTPQDLEQMETALQNIRKAGDI